MHRFAVAALLAAAACDGAITLTIASDRPVPAGLDAICVGIADVSETGGHFGRSYRLEGALASLPQTLRVEPGEADRAYGWARGDRGGVPVIRAGATFDFGSDVALELARCERGNGGAPAVRSTTGPPNARLAASQGAGGHLVVAIAEGTAMVIDADGASDAPAPPTGAIRDVVAADIDGDCDDDLVIVTDAAAPTIWRRDGPAFSALGTLGDAAASAVAAADVDHDGAMDLVTGGGASLALWRNDGTGAFAHDAEDLVAAGRVASVTALALGDLDNDGNADLVVGQAGDPLVAWLGEPGGTGRFNASPGAVPPVPLDVRSLVFANADDDLDPDLLVAVAGAPLRLYISRDGRLEDQTFVRLPDAPVDATAIAVGGWDASCEPDAVIAGATSLALHGQASNVFTRDSDLPAAIDAVLTDLDDDGALDLVLATREGVQWLAR